MGKDEWDEKSLLGWEDFHGMETHGEGKALGWAIFLGDEIIGKQKRWDGKSLLG